MESSTISSDQLPSPQSGIASWLGRPFWLELRTPFELRALRKSELWEGIGIPEGRGRPVVIIPGFMAGRGKTDAVEHILNQAGWKAVAPDVGRNSGPSINTINICLETIDQLVAETGQAVTIVGHSRGGQFGRVMAVEHPEKIRQVITLGSPLRAKYPNFLLVKIPAEFWDKVWRLGLLEETDPADEKWVDERRYAPFPDSVDLVSIYSRSDGLIDWRLMLEEPATGIEVVSTHQGIMNSIEGILGIAKGLRRLDS